MLPKLYYDSLSAPCRAVLLTIRAINLVEIKLYKVNINQKEQLYEEFVKANPELTVPTLIDGDVVLYESPAILKYLVAKYAASSGLYYEDAERQDLVDQRLNFNSNVLLPRVENIITPILSNEEKKVSKEKLIALKQCYEDLDKFLTNPRNEFVACNVLTIADFSCVASVSTASIILPICSEVFPNLFKWYQKCKALPYYFEANGIGLNEIDILIENKLRGRLT